MAFNKKEDVDKFFEKVASFVDEDINIYLLGGCSLLTLGSDRATQDIDFEIRNAGYKTIEQIQHFCEEENIPVNFSEDVSKWGMISISNNRDKAIPYNQFSKVKVGIVDPMDSIIGKIERYTDIDAQDVIFLIKKFSIKPDDLIASLAKALNDSVKSEKIFLFKKQVELFISTYSQSLWGVEKDDLLRSWSSLLKKTQNV